jgi:hypothetical protein
MKTAAALTALIAALAMSPSPASADDPGVDLRLNQGRSAAPIFVLEAEALFGALDVELTWIVNNWPIDEAPQQMQGEQLLDLRGLQLTESSVVCVEMRGRLSFGGDAGRDIEERDCVAYEPSYDPPRSLSGDSALIKEVNKRHVGLQADISRRR